jgi:hypothetical protein
MTRKQQPAAGRLINVIGFLKACDNVVSSLSVVLTATALLLCAYYALWFALGGTKSWWFLIIVVLLNSWMAPIMAKVTTEAGLEELKQNRAFELALVTVTIARNSLSAIVLFRLVLFTGVLLGEKGVHEGLPPLWDILHRVILG